MNHRIRKRVRWFGRILETDLPIHRYLPLAEDPAEVVLLREETLASAEPNDRSLYRSSFLVAQRPYLEVVERHGHLVVRFEHGSRFELRNEDIGYFVADSAIADAEICFLGLVSALWLEREGALCLHASAVEIEAAAVGFVGFNRAGKSSLAAGFLAEGHALVTDDVLALERSISGQVIAAPSFPQMRLWPTSAEQFVADAERLEPVYPELDKRRVPVGHDGSDGSDGNDGHDGLGTFVDHKLELKALFLPNRQGTTVSTTRLAPREALIELVRHSFLGNLGESVVGIDRRFERMAAIAEAVPVFRLTYPNGLEHLPRVRSEIRKALKTL